MTNKPKGVFSASKVANLCSGGTGATRKTYIYEVALDWLGIKKDFQTEAMRHGIATEQTAFEVAVKPKFPDAIFQSDKSIKINDDLYASPDSLISSGTVDIKCPQLLGFYTAKESEVSKLYQYQVQTQILAVDGSIGYLCYYLQKPIHWDNADTWEDYEFENFDDNHFFKEIPKNEQIQEEILKAVELAVPERNELIEKFVNAKEIEFAELIKNIKSGMRFGKYKESNWKQEAFKFENDFYYWKN